MPKWTLKGRRGTLRLAVTLSDGEKLAFVRRKNPELWDKVNLTVAMPPDHDRLWSVRDLIRGIYKDAIRRGLNVGDLAVLLDHALDGRSLTALELAYVVAAGRMLEREAERARKIATAEHARRVKEEQRRPDKDRALQRAREILARTRIRHTRNSLAETLHEELGFSVRTLNDWLKPLFACNSKQSCKRKPRR